MLNDLFFVPAICSFVQLALVRYEVLGSFFLCCYMLCMFLEEDSGVDCPE